MYERMTRLDCHSFGLTERGMSLYE